MTVISSYPSSTSSASSFSFLSHFHVPPPPLSSRKTKAVRREWWSTAWTGVGAPAFSSSASTCCYSWTRRIFVTWAIASSAPGRPSPIASSTRNSWSFASKWPNCIRKPSKSTRMNEILCTVAIGWVKRIKCKRVFIIDYNWLYWLSYRFVDRCTLHK